MLLERPTIFGMQNGNYRAGEAGSEVAAGADKLMNMIRSAVDVTNKTNSREYRFYTMLNAFKSHIA